MIYFEYLKQWIMAFWSRKQGDTQTFADLIRGLQHSVNTAMEILEDRNIQLLGRYFTPEGTPLTRRLSIDDQTAVDVPLVSIVNPVSMNIKEVEMNFSVQINAAEIKTKNPQGGFLAGSEQTELCGKIDRSCLEVSFGGKKDCSRMDVRIKFESHPVPEGLARVIDEYDKTILPFDKKFGSL